MNNKGNKVDQKENEKTPETKLKDMKDRSRKTETIIQNKVLNIKF